MRILSFIAATLLITVSLRADDLAQNAYFKHIVGKWTAEGELKGENDNVVRITEEWTGKATAEGGFLIEGTRELNDKRQVFKWSITRNPTTDTYEIVHTVDGDEANAMRFEGNLSEVNLTLEMRAPSGSSGSITVFDGFEGEAKEVLKSKVTFTGDSGDVTLSGTITHKKTAPGS